MSREPVDPRRDKYRGGRDSNWREIAQVRVTSVAGAPEPVAGQSLPPGFLWADPTKQFLGFGAPRLVYGPLEKRCRQCAAAFVFTAKAQ